MSFGPPCGPYVSMLLNRVRDPAGSSTSRDFARSILSRVQQVVNAYSRLVIETDTLPTTPFRQIYSLSAEIPKAIHVLGVNENQKALVDAGDWTQLAMADRQWFRRTGDHFDTFARCGRDILILTPARNDASTVYVVYVKLTEILTDDNVPFDLHEDDLPTVMDIAEAVLLLRTRNLASIDQAIARASGRLGILEPTTK